MATNQSQYEKMCEVYEKYNKGDLVPVVRCKDCKWWKTIYFWEGHEHKICARESHEPSRKAEDYCSLGERRKDGQ